MMNRGLYIIICFVFFMDCCAPEPKPHNPSNTHITTPQKKSPKSPSRLAPSDIFERCNNAVFLCYADDGYSYSQGSGFFINSKGIGVSNYHVFEGMNSGYIKLVTGQEYDIEFLKCNSQKDYVIFRVLTNSKIKFPIIPISRRPYKVGHTVYALGSPKGMSNTFNEGGISNVRKNTGCGTLIQISVPIDHGSSGGVLLNSYGEAIGITSRGITSQAALNFALDIHELDADLKSLGVVR